MSAAMTTHPVTKATWRSALSLLCVAALMCATLTGVASAKDKGKAKGKEKGVYLLPEAKKADQVGEKPDGYLGLVDQDAPEIIKKMVVDTNERRKGRYKEVATRSGSTLESVEVLAGEKLAKRAKPNEFLLGKDGKWIKKKDMK